MAQGRTNRTFLVSRYAEDPQVARSEDSYLFDERGRRYIDFLTGWNVGNFGWGNREIKAAIRRFSGPEYVYPHYRYKPWTELARLLAGMAPGKLRQSFRATGGTEAVELALQIAAVYTKRHKFVSIANSYHGNSLATLSLGAPDNRRTPKNLLPNCRKLQPPLDRKAVARVERLLKGKDVAAFIMEPVILNLGVLIPEQEFMQALRELCTKYGTLLVLDEVATGFGRTGKLFASEHFGIEPDVMTVAKAITGGYAGMGATMTTDRIGNAVSDKVSAYSTYGWHPLSVASAIATLKYIRQHKRGLLGNVANMSDYFAKRMSQMEFRKPAAVRIKGLAVGLDIGNANQADRLADKCRHAGLLLTAEDGTLLMFPPLNIRMQAAREGLDILEDCLG